MLLIIYLWCLLMVIDGHWCLSLLMVDAGCLGWHAHWRLIILNDGLSSLIRAPVFNDSAKPLIPLQKQKKSEHPHLNIWTTRRVPFNKDSHINQCKHHHNQRSFLTPIVGQSSSWADGDLKWARWTVVGRESRFGNLRLLPQHSTARCGLKCDSFRFWDGTLCPILWQSPDLSWLTNIMKVHTCSHPTMPDLIGSYLGCFGSENAQLLIILVFAKIAKPWKPPKICLPLIGNY